jgi:hypothetical protein
MADTAQPKKKQVGRPFQPGVSGNPCGRPKSLGQLKQYCVEHGLDKLKELVEDCWYQLKVHDRVDLVEMMLAYGYGKPTQMVEATVNVNDLTAEQRQARLAELLAVAVERSAGVACSADAGGAGGVVETPGAAGRPN